MVSKLQIGTQVQRLTGTREVFRVYAFHVGAKHCAFAKNIRDDGHRIALYDYDFTEKKFAILQSTQGGNN